ncbi:SF3A1 [Mytilus coruscus]|uniref:SF3A1 n=1 Tax=Mytilus coruscus TaxID=42192 RepID=A0A6J8D9P5_MYTCO|nr:SF3A1 [Mytilus coruscus]
MVPKADDKPEWKLNGQMLTYTLPLSDSIAVMKAKLNESLGLPAGKQKLQYDGIFMKDSNSLAYYNINKGATNSPLPKDGQCTPWHKDRQCRPIPKDRQCSLWPKDGQCSPWPEDGQCTPCLKDRQCSQPSFTKCTPWLKDTKCTPWPKGRQCTP